MSDLCYIKKAAPRGPRSAMSSPLDIQELLGSLGFHHPEAQAAARQAMEEAGLTRPGKANIAPEKQPAVVELLGVFFLVACQDPRCQAIASAEAEERRLLPIGEPGDCFVCRGSPNRRAATMLRRLLAKKGLRRLVVVGGSPGTREDLLGLLGDHLEIRLIDGTTRRSAAQARQDVQWADLVLIWGSTELDHSVSSLYSQGRQERKVVTATRRGVAALLEEALSHVSR
jgi:hypothetical protein